MNVYIRNGLIVGVLGISTFFIIKLIRNKKLLREFGSMRNITNDNRGNDLGTDDAGSDYGIIAKQLFEYMDGVDWFNSNESKIMSTIQNLTCTERKAVKKEFELTYGKGETLDDWLKDDLGSNNLIKARNLMNC